MAHGCTEVLSNRASGGVVWSAGNVRFWPIADVPITSCNLWSVTLPANARTLGSSQLDAIQNMTGTVGDFLVSQSAASGVFTKAIVGQSTYGAGTVGDYERSTFDASNVARTSTETRATNAAFTPIISL